MQRIPNQFSGWADRGCSTPISLRSPRMMFLMNITEACIMLRKASNLRIRTQDSVRQQ